MDSDDLNLYKIWAPEFAEWTAWAKPVLFDRMSFSSRVSLDLYETPLQPEQRTMVIVDLPGKQSVLEALACAGKGYRPVPLYNGTMGSGNMLVNVREVSESLLSGAELLNAQRLSYTAPPAFMLDSNRMSGYREPGLYDNRWCVFPQDMPSASYIVNKGINKIIVRTERYVLTDLEVILYDYQKNGIALYILQNGKAAPEALSVRRQNIFDEWAYRFKVTLGLKRNATGGFGGMIPEPYERSESSMHYYGIG